MKKQLTTLVIVCITLLTACGSSPSVQQVQSTATLAPPTVTFTPTLTSTPEPTFTPTATATPRLPVLPGTQIPSSDTVLSADNLDQVVELARWGKGVITDAVYSPDEKFIAVATTLGVSVYQADTLEEKFYFDTDAKVTSLTYSPDAGTLATGLANGTVGLWSASDGDLLKSLVILKDADISDLDKVQVSSLAFSADGKLLVSGLSNGFINIWQVSDGTLLLTPATKQRLAISSVFFSPDGSTVFSSSYDGTINSRNVPDGKIIRAFGGGRIHDAVLSADGKFLAAYDRRYYNLDGNLIIWDVESGKKIQTIPGAKKYSSNDISSLAFSPDGQLLAGAWEDHTVKIWNVSSGVIQNTFEELIPKNGRYYLNYFATAFSPNGHSLLLAGSDSMGIWNVTDGSVLKTAVIKSNAIYKIAMSPDGQTLAAVDGPNIRLWQINDGNLISVQSEIQSNGDVVFSPDGTTLIVSTFDSSAQTWPLSDKGTRRTFEMENKAYILSIAISPDGRILALEPRAQPQSTEVELRQVSDGSLLRTMRILGAYNGEISFSSSGEFLAVFTDETSTRKNPEIRLFRVSDSKFLKSFKGDNFAFSSDGLLLTGKSDDRLLTMWTIPDGKEVLTLKNRPDNISNVVFSPDGRLFVVGYSTGTIEMYLASDGTLLKSWNGHLDEITDLVFTPDGSLLISSSYDGTIQVWGLKR